MESSEFQGFVKAKLEGLSNDTTEIKGTLDKINGRVRRNEQDVSALKVKSGVFGVIGGSLVMIPVAIRMAWKSMTS